AAQGRHREAIARAREFRRIGADITFLEAPLDVDEMRAYCDAVDGPKVANLVEGGDTPILSPTELGDLGYKLSMNPLTLQMASVRAIEQALTTLAGGERPTELTSFADLQEIAGFPEYFAAEQRYATDDA
ncbi:MAG: carboxyvinyl-carboxyphosphonate phosphorylmutase, partial [Actinomycetota bacterium]